MGTSTGVGGDTETTITLTPTLTRYDYSITYSGPTGSVRAMLIWRTGNTATSVYAWGAQVSPGSAALAAEGASEGNILLTFASTEYRYWRLKVLSPTGATMPSLAIAAFGEALDIPAYLTSGFDPLGRKVVGQSNRSEGGQPLGRVIDFEEWREPLKFELLTWDWLRSSFNPAWAAHLRSEPFGFVWDADSHADEVRLVQSGSEYKTPHRTGGYADLTLEVFGVIS
jgi:hypothetical protein